MLGSYTPAGLITYAAVAEAHDLAGLDHCAIERVADLTEGLTPTSMGRWG